MYTKVAFVFFQCSVNVVSILAVGDNPSLAKRRGSVELVVAYEQPLIGELPLHFFLCKKTSFCHGGTLYDVHGDRTLDYKFFAVHEQL